MDYLTDCVSLALVAGKLRVKFCGPHLVRLCGRHLNLVFTLSSFYFSSFYFSLIQISHLFIKKKILLCFQKLCHALLE